MSRLSIGYCALLVSATCLPVRAAIIDITTLVSNSGFENGNLSGWTVTRPNTTNYVASLTPPVNPSIDPADPADDPTTLTAPAGLFFIGIKRVGDVGPDLSYKVAHDAFAVAVPTGTTFQVKVFANRGRLEPFDTPVSTADVSVKIFGWTGGTTIPTVTAGTDNWSRTINWNPAGQAFDFTSIADGNWGNRTLTFDPSAAGIDAANLKYLTISVTAQTHNHDQYVATDIGSGEPIPEPATAVLLASACGLMLVRRRR